MTKEQKKAIIVAIIAVGIMVFITFFRNGTSW